MEKLSKSQKRLIVAAGGLGASCVVVGFLKYSEVHQTPLDDAIPGNNNNVTIWTRETDGTTTIELRVPRGSDAGNGINELSDAFNPSATLEQRKEWMGELLSTRAYSTTPNESGNYEVLTSGSVEYVRVPNSLVVEMLSSNSQALITPSPEPTALSTTQARSENSKDEGLDLVPFVAGGGAILGLLALGSWVAYRLHSFSKRSSSSPKFSQPVEVPKPQRIMDVTDASTAAGPVIGITKAQELLIKMKKDLLLNNRITLRNTQAVLLDDQFLIRLEAEKVGTGQNISLSSDDLVEAIELANFPLGGLQLDQVNKNGMHFVLRLIPPKVQ
jgi:hypothetical protein